MLETEEVIQMVLSRGEKLEFDAFDIYALPSFDTDILVSQEVSVYRVETQLYDFQVSTKDCIDNEIVAGDTFTMSDNSYAYSFKLKANPIPYQDGWSRLSVDHIGKEEI